MEEKTMQQDVTGEQMEHASATESKHYPVAHAVSVLEAYQDEARIYASLILGGMSVSDAADFARSNCLVKHPVSYRALLNAIKAGLIPGVEEGRDCNQFKDGGWLASHPEDAAKYSSLILGRGLSVSGAAKAAKEEDLVERPLSKSSLTRAVREGLVPGVDESVLRTYTRSGSGGIASLKVGVRIGRLTVLEVVRGDGDPVARCLCDCGRQTTVNAYCLGAGKVKSCGCAKQGTGKSSHPLYRRYRSMLERCNSESSWSYENYGARGIRVCDEWSNDFWAYEKFMVDNGWTEGCDLTMDRVDPDGDYCPENVILVPASLQGRHKRHNRKVTVGSVTMDLAEWAERTGIGAQTISNRLDNGWPPAEAVTVRPGKPRRR